jgi:hypothetical protein
MNHIKWAAWGVVELDNPERFDRIQRRNFLKKVHAELAPHNMKLSIGGSKINPWYAVSMFAEIEVGSTPPKTVVAGKDAFKKICVWVLEQLGEDAHERGADGGVRCAGDEAQDGSAGVAG